MKAFLVDRAITGSGEAPIQQAVVLIKNGRIEAVGSRYQLRIPEEAERIEAPGHTLMPGMVDVHLHLAYSGIPHKRAFRAEAIDMSYPLMALRAASHARATLEAGFTSVRDLNSPGGVIIDLREAVEAGYLAGPRIRACGLGLSATGGHMDQPGFGDHVCLAAMNAVCDGPEGFRRGVREQVKRGADLIKINLCVSSVADPDHPYRQEMSDEEIETACEEARRLERPVAAHTSGGAAITTAVRYGLASVEHGHWLDEETAELMAEQGTTYVPTLLVNERNFDFGKEQLGATEDSWQWLNLAREAKWKSLEIARQAGVRIAVGTDAGFMLPHGEMNAHELELLVRGGLTPLEAITAATKNGAELLGLKEVGTLKAGNLADLILVKGDPSVDIRTLQRLPELRVFKAGKEV